jgi:hypothetical protein
MTIIIHMHKHNSDDEYTFSVYYEHYNAIVCGGGMIGLRNGYN